MVPDDMRWGDAGCHEGRNRGYARGEGEMEVTRFVLDDTPGLLRGVRKSHRREMRARRTLAGQTHRAKGIEVRAFAVRREVAAVRGRATCEWRLHFLQLLLYAHVQGSHALRDGFVGE